MSKRLNDPRERVVVAAVSGGPDSVYLLRKLAYGRKGTRVIAGHEIGLLNLPERAPALRTEAIQHGVFKYGILPVAFYGTLAGIMWYSHRTRSNDNPHAREQGSAPPGQTTEGGGR